MLLDYWIDMHHAELITAVSKIVMTLRVFSHFSLHDNEDDEDGAKILFKEQVLISYFFYIGRKE